MNPRTDTTLEHYFAAVYAKHFAYEGAYSVGFEFCMRCGLTRALILLFRETPT